MSAFSEPLHLYSNSQSSFVVPSLGLAARLVMSCCWTHSWAGVFEIFCAHHETATAVVQRRVGLGTKLAAYSDRENITIVLAWTAKKKDYCSMPRQDKLCKCKSKSATQRVLLQKPNQAPHTICQTKRLDMLLAVRNDTPCSPAKDAQQSSKPNKTSIPS